MRSALVPWRDLVGAPLLPRRHLDRDAVADAVPLASLCDVASGTYADAYVPANTPGAAPFLRVNNVRAFVPNLTPGDLEHVLPASVWGERVRVAPGDVILARTATLGRAFVAPRRLAGAVMSQHVTRLRLRPSTPLRPLLLAAYLNSPPGKAQVLALASGSTRLELTHDDIQRIRLPSALLARADLDIPDLDRDLDDAIDRARAAFAACERLVPPPGPRERHFCVAHDHAALVRTLTPRFHRPGAAALEAALADAFECRPLADLARVQRGAGSLAAEYQHEGIPYIRTSSIINHGIELFPEHRGSEATHGAHGQDVGPGDLLLTIEGKIGAVALLGAHERCLLKNHVEFIRLRRPAPVPAEFVYALLASSIGQAQLERRTVVQATIPGLGPASRELRVPIAGRTPAAQALLTAVIAAVTADVQRAQAARARIHERLHALTRALDGHTQTTSPGP